MKNLFKNYKPSAFAILFIILSAVGLATWFVKPGEYVYTCTDGAPVAFTYENPEGKKTAICPIDEIDEQNLIVSKEKGNDTLYEYIDATIEYERSEPVYEYVQTEPKRQGLWNIAQAPVDGFIAAVEIIVFIFAIGGFINLIIKSGAMDAGVFSLLNRFKGKEIYLIPILMTLFAIGGTTYGMAEETIVFYVILIPVLYRAGFDNIVGMMIIALGAGIGTLASTVNPFAIGVASEAASVSPGAGIVGRFVFWIICLVIAILFVMKYAKKVKNNPEKSLTYDNKEMLDKEFLDDHTDKQLKLNSGQKWILAVMGITFTLMVISVIPWVEAFHVEFFDNITSSLNNLSIPFMGGDAGILAFGHWYFVEMTTLFVIASFVIGCIAKANKLIDGQMLPHFIEGAKDMMSVALIIGLARGIQIILENSGMAATLLYYGTQMLSGLPKPLFSVLTYILYIPLSFFIPSTSGLATATMPIIGDLAYNVFGGDAGKIEAITAYSAASGLVNLVTPTSGVIMAALAISKVELGRWFKAVMPLLVVIFIVSILFLWITTQFNIYA